MNGCDTRRMRTTARRHRGELAHAIGDNVLGGFAFKRAEKLVDVILLHLGTNCNNRNASVVGRERRRSSKRIREGREKAKAAR
jgi:hypothetical protein